MGLLSRLKSFRRDRAIAPPPYAPPRALRFEDLTEPLDELRVPWLDRSDVDERDLNDDQRHWRRHGYVIKSGFVPPELVDAYCAVREPLGRPEGWHTPVPYVHVPEIRDLCLHPPLMALLRELIGGEMGMHLNLTGWVSTERNWHQDDYLNPDFVQAWYCAVWFALDDIDPDCGPFEFVPGSHKWDPMSGAKVRTHLPPDEARQIGHRHSGDVGHWAQYAERFVNGAFDDKIARSGIEPKRFLGRKGDVLVWHSRLAHRGSEPRQRGSQRKAIITHYSALDHRPDMVFRRHAGGGAYAHFDIPLY
ncbi:MAG TPA: phytanoyl-CoA dioxygenase family protein [Candidatus Binatia bacterium]|nr:phytanoyl-CoA dioxygenase family protein [Candidatus Binatia bacterium]